MGELRYRPEIDGLRAVAVLAVVLYHSGFGCPGGYIGVDVFFVISGFLITSLIWSDLEEGRFTFAGFWERRVRRIVPALVIVTLVTLVAGWLLLLPEDLSDLGRASAAQSTFLANIYYWLQSGYFERSAEEKALLHTWSLAVEEQFYLIAPFLLYWLFRLSSINRRRAALISITTGLLLSFVLSIYGVAHHREATFYLLPTRSWELLFGALVTFIPKPVFLAQRIFWRELCAFLGISLILAPALIYSPITPFPGLAALPPCFGAALLIWINTRTNQSIPTSIGWLLARRPMVGIGLISYSLYLWHWPPIAFSKYVSVVPFSLGQRVVILASSVGMASLSWKLIETPFRRKILGKHRASMFGLSGVGLGTILVASLICIAGKGFPQRLSPEVQRHSLVTLTNPFARQSTPEDVRDGKPIYIGAANSEGRPVILVWGDSHAMAALPALDAFLKESGLSGCAVARGAAPPVLDWYPIVEWSLERELITYNERVISYIESHRIPNALLICRWQGYREPGLKSGGRFESLNEALVATVSRLVSIGCCPWVMLDVPNHNFNIRKALTRPTYSPAYIDSLCSGPTTWNELDKDDPMVIKELKAAGARLMDPKPLFLDPTGQHYVVQKNNVALYTDMHHLTTAGAKLLLLPFFREILLLRSQFRRN